MRFLLLVFLFLASFSSWSAELSTDEELTLVELVKSVVNAYGSGDADKIVESTFDPIVTAAGGSESLKLKTRQAIEQQRQAGVVIESTTIGKPTALVAAGEYQLCFVTRETVMQMPGKRGRTTSFMVAVRKPGATEWQLIDGAGLRQRPQILWLLFPELPEYLALPVNKLELLP
ncbi:hypothetical protein ABIC94_003742 [Variovorax paradoxus]|uniref:hypothetical protein n=1 Tax=Variovorax paradoxus TaxID=34073 RepID=UPI003397EB71